MDFVTLGVGNSNDYIPQTLVEGYHTLIWAEKYSEYSQFELKSYDVAVMKDVLPKGMLVSHLETEEVMIVETHNIQMVGEGADAIPEISIKGRSALKILDDRWVESTYQKKRKMRKKYSATSAACVLVYQAVDNGSGFDLTRGDDDPDTEGVVNSYTWNELDKLPNTCVTEVVAAEGATRWWLLEEGILMPQLRKILLDEDLSIRCLRPVLPNSRKVVTVQSSLSVRGTIVRTETANVSQLRFEIYKGLDKSATIKFSLLQGHIDKPQYLESDQGYKTGVEIISGSVSVSDVYRPGESGLSGWERRIVGFDAGEPEIPPAPEKPEELNANATNAEKTARANAMDAWKVKYGKWKNKRDNIVDDFREEVTLAARRVLKGSRKIDIFAGDVSDLSPYTYRVDYGLGDTVMIYGDYGKSAKMIVSEYVRTEDASGDRGFPGLVAPQVDGVVVDG